MRPAVPKRAPSLAFLLLPLAQADTWSSTVLVDELDACVHDRFFDFSPRVFTTAKLAFGRLKSCDGWL